MLISKEKDVKASVRPSRGKKQGEEIWTSVALVQPVVCSCSWHFRTIAAMTASASERSCWTLLLSVLFSQHPLHVLGQPNTFPSLPRANLAP